MLSRSLSRRATAVSSGVRAALGACAHDLLPYVAALSSREGWVRVCNRGDELDPGPGGKGVRIRSPWATALEAPRSLPLLGTWLARRALTQWPIEFGVSAEGLRSVPPEVSVIIPFRGADRLPQLRSVIQSLLAQRQVAWECILVEQSPTPIAQNVSNHIRHVHLPHPRGEHWYKSWAHNVGARLAKGRSLVFLDADVCMPMGYLKEVCDTLDDGVEMAALGRFMFYLGRKETRAVTETGALPRRIHPTHIRQNWTGHTVAISSQAFAEIGGYDEGFVDWSAEDNEFYQRAITRLSWVHRYVPFVHLWHSPQPNRRHILSQPESLARLSVGPEQRIAELRATRWGDPDHPPEARFLPDSGA